MLCYLALILLYLLSKKLYYVSRYVLPSPFGSEVYNLLGEGAEMWFRWW